MTRNFSFFNDKASFKQGEGFWVEIFPVICFGNYISRCKYLVSNRVSIIISLTNCNCFNDLSKSPTQTTFHLILIPPAPPDQHKCQQLGKGENITLYFIEEDAQDAIRLKWAQ